MTTDNTVESDTTTERDRFVGFAVSVRATARFLQKDLNCRIKSVNNKSSIDLNTNALLVGHTISMVILKALAVEYILKYLADKIKGTFCKAHDLIELFDDLGADATEYIENHCKKHGIRAMREILEDHRTDFIEWRYPQNRAISTNFLDIDKALDVLIDISENTGFKHQFYRM